MELVIATGNSNKIWRLEKIITTIHPDIHLTNISELHFNPPWENGLTQVDNLLIKLKYYYRLLGKNIISEDDIVEFKIGSEYVPIISVDHLLSAGKDPFTGWGEYLQKNKIHSGRLIKQYGVVIDGKIKTGQVIFPLMIKTSGITKSESEKNILNNFVGPKRIGETFVEMTIVERDGYMQVQCSPVLKRLLAK